MNNLVERINSNKSVIGLGVVGVDGCQSPYRGIIKEFSVYDHSILGRLVQVWVAWEWNPNHLTPYFPREFSKWEGQCVLGVYYIQESEVA